VTLLQLGQRAREKGKRRRGEKEHGGRAPSSPFLLFSLAPFQLRLALTLAMLFLSGVLAPAEPRFPPPDFSETKHQLPITTTPAAREVWLQYADIVVLAGCLGLATWLVHRQRSRRGLMWLGIFSLLYFGFWRRGCVCSIGSPQNLALGLFDSTYAVPLVVTAFFALPLVVALFAGRTFCAAVCPHGALQDLVLLKPKKVPAWLEHGLSVLPFVFLGAGIWLATTGTIFLFCHYDPFVPLFRFGGRSAMVLTGVGLLALGTVVGRPYCRFACPYGAMLKLASIVAKWRVRTTPDICTQCRLCEQSCPYGAMREPEAGAANPLALPRDRRRLGWLIAALPVLLLAGIWLGDRLSVPAAGLNPHVALAREYLANMDTLPAVGALTPAELALNRARQEPEAIVKRGAELERRIRIGGWIFGAWVGLVIGGKLISLALRRRRTDYEPDRGACVACARCFTFCPQELVRRGVVPTVANAEVVK
jgi:NosR/NirI family nitrous oxide reductase transcriptional regulator